jgi:hypothetical protein
MKPKDIPHSPLPNQRSGGLPQCSALTKTRNRCKARAAGKEALEKLELLDHAHAGEWCSFHLIGGKALSDKGHAAKRQARKLRAEAAEARKLAEATGLPVEPEAVFDKSQPGEVVVTIDPDRDYSEPEPEPVRTETRSIYNLESIPHFGMLTPEQRKTVLRARLRGS